MKKTAPADTAKVQTDQQPGVAPFPIFGCPAERAAARLAAAGVALHAIISSGDPTKLTPENAVDAAFAYADAFLARIP